MTSSSSVHPNRPFNLNFDSQETKHIETLRSERRSPSPLRKSEEKDRLGKAAASQNSSAFFNFSPEEKSEKQKNYNTILERIENAILSPFIFIRDEWTTIKETSRSISRILKIVVIHCSELTRHLSKVIAGLGLLMGLEALFILNRYPQTVSIFLKNIELKDIEGAILSLFSLMASTGTALISFITYVTSLKNLGIIPSIPFIGVVTQPLSLALSTYSSLRGIYDIIWLFIHLNAIPKEITLDNLDDLKAKLRQKFEMSEEEKKETEGTSSDRLEIAQLVEQLKEKKTRKLTRQTDIKIVAIMKNLLEHLEKNHKDVETTNKALTDIRTLIGRKIVTGTLNTLGTIASEIALVTSMIIQISPVVMPAIGLARAALTQTKRYYEQNYFDKGLNLPDWILT